MTSLGAYELGERIAVGGMAEIFRARSAAEPGDLVVKRLLPQYARDPEVVSMLAHEGALMQRLAHPALIRVVDVCAEGDTPFLVLEHIDGLPLSELLDEPVSPAMALAVVRPILTALAHVHAANDDDGEPLDVVHRDVTPHNVMVDRAGRVRLGDFGIARSSLRDARTRTGMIKGKLRYLAPEQVTGSTVDARTDLYAVGLLLFELVAGEPFLSADTEPALLRLAEAPSARSCGHAAIDKVLKRALARFPETRPKDAAAFLRALESAIEGEPDRRAWASRVLAALGPPAPVASADPRPAAPEGKRGRFGWVAAFGAAGALAAGWALLGSPPETAPVQPPPVDRPEPAVQASPPPEPASPVPEPAPPPAPAPLPPPAPARRRANRERVARVELPPPPVEAPDASDPDEEGRAAAQLALRRIDTGLRRRGIRVGDLATEQRAALASSRTAAVSGAPDLDALSTLETTLAELAVDEAFVRRKLQRVDARIRAARERGEDVTDIERRSALALQSLLEHRPTQTNDHLNAILDRLAR